MTGRALPCGSANARLDIMLHWRLQARLTETAPGSGKWRGACPKDGKPGGLNVTVGNNGMVIWNTPLCGHDRAAAYPALHHLVPCAPAPSPQRNPELDALKAAIRALVTNERFTHSNPVKLAVLEVLGDSTDDALTALGITDRGHRRRTRVARDKALSPAKIATNGNKRRSGARKSETRIPAALPAETHLPAALATNGNPGAATNGNPPSTAKPPPTSTFASLTGRATLVSGPAGTDTDTGTAVDLDLALRALETLGAEVIASEPRTSPHPVADAIDTWTASEAGPCQRCGGTTCRYGDRGSPLCPDCQSAEVRTPG